MILDPRLGTRGLSFEAATSELRKLALEITKENFQSYYDKMSDVVLRYRETGARGKPLHEFVFALWKELDDNDVKDEVLGETMNRMVGYCGPSYGTIFWDYDQLTNKWKDE